ncbi:MAG: alkaline phosphatase family protein [Nitrospirae bacterium]|nr:alkaline phosphatase family protein [Nitrospirota bacterium]
MPEGSPQGRSVFILGLDGGTYDLILPWVQEGRLPNLGRLIQSGSHAELASTVPPMTPPGWTSFMTGMNPGKHGIFDFTEREPGRYEVKIMNATDRQARTIWSLMSQAGKRVASIGVPLTYPPEPVNGVMISGFDSPVLDRRIMHPPELFDELEKSVGGYPVSPDFVRHAVRGDLKRAVEIICETMDQKARAVEYLLKREAWDCFMLVFGETDACIHYFWGHHDPASPHRPRHPDPGPDPIRTVYEKVDEILGRLLPLLPPDSGMMLISDHGTGGAGRKMVYLNRWLEAEGFLAFRAGSGRGCLRTMNWRLLEEARSWARAVLPQSILKRLRYRSGLGARLESNQRFSGLDWKRTAVYSDETPHYPNLWVNLKGREPQGVVNPGEEYESLRERILERLSEWRDPETRRPLIKRAYKREEVYHGPCLERAPDILIAWNLDGNYSYLNGSSLMASGRAPVVAIDPTGFWRSKSMLNRGGSHRENGIFLIRGEGVQRGHRLLKAGIADMAPTLLYWMGLPVPSDMDGTVLTEAFEDSYRRGHPVHRDGISGQETQDRARLVYSEEETKKVEERLQSLGYIE